MNKIVCTEPGCGNSAWAQGLCSHHWGISITEPVPAETGAQIIGCNPDPKKDKMYRITTQNIHEWPEWVADFLRAGDAFEYAHKIAPRFPSTSKVTIVARRRK